MIARLAALSFVALAAACGGNHATFSAHIGSPTRTARQTGAPQALTLANGIVLTRVRMVIQHIELRVAEDHDGNEDVNVDNNVDEEGGSGPKIGPFIVDASGAALDNGTPQVLLNASVPKGVYKKIQFKIHKVEVADGTSAALTAMRGKSVVLEGTIDGAAFNWESTLDEEQERKATFNVGGSDNLTFNFDPTGWFTKNGARLDPRDAANKSDIEKNIKESFEAYDDDDKDGKR